ncbi:MAG: Gfo/Idh/MocA family oxidoreductase [Puniceicoccales bacterium]|nr:Gfo/Idh/MocA family oxidoreductase [Puniceicoccales bacterium]
MGKISIINKNSRREFMANCAALASLPVLASLPTNAFAAGNEGRLKVGLIGAGGRGIGAARESLDADKNVQLWAIGDVFEDRAEQARKQLARKERGTVPQERVFNGFDAYKDVLNTGVDLVILAAPPGFRPLHMEAAVEKGVHIFAEKPVAVDPAGARKVIAVGELARQKGLSIVAGTQRRHDASYIETIRRIQGGAIGDLVGGQCYWVGGELWHNGRKPEWTDMEYQIRNWLYFTWLSGDHIVEQHVHNLDVINWAFGGPPVKAFGMGGRQVRTGEKYGNAWDHFAVEFEYANGVRVQSFCRQTNGASHRVSERLVGTLGTADPKQRIWSKNGDWASTHRRTNAYLQEHVDLIRSIRQGEKLNEARSVAEATLTAILGRESAYTGKEIKYEWILKASKQDLSPAKYEFGAAPGVEFPKPGRTAPV